MTNRGKELSKNDGLNPSFLPCVCIKARNVTKHSYCRVNFPRTDVIWLHVCDEQHKENGPLSICGTVKPVLSDHLKLDKS